MHSSHSVESLKAVDPILKPRAHWAPGVVSGLFFFGVVAGFGQGQVLDELAEMDVEQLTRVYVTSVSKHEESRFTAGAAIYVISHEELRRNGFTTLADSLRTVPGMNVGQVNSHTWAVSARGFNGEYATKLLVLNDGRSVYTPLSSGVYWDTQDFMFDDVERIEVIRGPGATLWGANAVNGVINVISKNARDTQGLLVTGGAGSEERGFGAVRYGGQLSENAWYRAYVKHADHDDMVFANDTDAMDDWWMSRTGFRIDWEPAEVNQVTFQGDYYQGRESHLITQPVVTPPFFSTHTLDSDVSGGNLLGRWTHQLADDAEFKFQTYYDHSKRESNLPSEQRDTFDLEWQHSFHPLEGNRITWGLGYRVTSDRIEGDFAQSFVPAERTLNLISAFAQDEITLVPDRLNLTLGSKFEHNDFTGFEFQPGSRLVWTPTANQTFWGAISRAVRTPSRAESDVQVNSLAGFTILGNPSGVSEELLAYELGYRMLPHPKVSLDFAAFYNSYEELRSLETIPTSPVYSDNKLDGETYGVEVGSEWQVLDCWRLRVAYTYLRAQLHIVDGGADPFTEALIEGSAPQQQFSLRSIAELTRNVEFDWGVRFVDSLHNPEVPAYVTLDARLAWRPTEQLELSLVGLNLLDDRHPEFASQIIITPMREVERSIYGKITWHF
jgi:iron complex outermembrane receptor protein